MRSKGEFGLTMSCASHVQAIGKGFPGQLGIFGDEHLEGLKRLTDEIKSHNSLAVAQLHHAGMRSPEDLIGEQPVCPSDDEETNSRALSLDEVKQLRDDFIEAGVRAKKAGYEGAEVHGAHGYILCQFLSPDINKREDEYGGSLENRSRLLFEIVEGIRNKCGTDFLLGVRLSAERFGIRLGETKTVCTQLIEDQKIVENAENAYFSTLPLKKLQKILREENFKVENSLSIPLKEARENFEKEYLTTQLKKFGGNISKMAKFIGMERSALHRKLKILGGKMKILEALNIISEEMVFRDDDGNFKPDQAVEAWQLIIDSGIVGFLSEWHRFYARYMIDHGVISGPTRDPNYVEDMSLH